MEFVYVGAALARRSVTLFVDGEKAGDIDEAAEDLDH